MAMYKFLQDIFDQQKLIELEARLDWRHTAWALAILVQMAISPDTDIDTREYWIIKVERYMIIFFG